MGTPFCDAIGFYKGEFENQISVSLVPVPLLLFMLSLLCAGTLLRSAVETRLGNKPALTLSDTQRQDVLNDADYSMCVLFSASGIHSLLT